MGDEKDNFHTLFLVLTKQLPLVWLFQQFYQHFLFPKGVMDGVRPLEVDPII
jgi:hypothetical protein